MKKLSLLIFTLLIAISLYAQKSETNVEQLNHEVGLQLGSTTGMGLSYRYWSGNYGVQLTLLPVKSSTETYINSGVTGLYSFYNAKQVRFFAYLANNLIVDNTKQTNYSYDANNNLLVSNSTSRNVKYNIGFGPGFEFGSRVGVDIMAGYGLYDVCNKFEVYPAGEIGLYFRY